MSKVLLFIMYFVSFLPLWLSVAIIDIKNIVMND